MSDSKTCSYPGFFVSTALCLQTAKAQTLDSWHLKKKTILATHKITPLSRAKHMQSTEHYSFWVTLHVPLSSTVPGVTWSLQAVWRSFINIEWSKGDDYLSCQEQVYVYRTLADPDFSKNKHGLVQQIMIKAWNLAHQLYISKQTFFAFGPSRIGHVTNMAAVFWKEGVA